ncbi:hypothetical protein [Methylocella sp.]|uniref:bestrophin-like domain n=1 Tax=Methylocella sp. TaxID=1978226 RepID=UPI003C1441E9
MLSSGRIFELNIFAIYAAIIILVAGAAEVGNWIGRRFRKPGAEGADIGTLTAAALGLLALLLAFSFSIALSRFDARRDMVLEEANAIGSVANFARLLPQDTQTPILSLLRDYAAVRLALGDASDAKRQDDIARSLDLQGRLWREAAAASAAAPQSLPAYSFANALNELTNIHERRLANLRYHVPPAVIFMLIGVAIVAMGFTGYNSGFLGARRRAPDLIMSVTIALLIMLVLDLDDPRRGLIQVPVQPLVDVAGGLAAPRAQRGRGEA